MSTEVQENVTQEEPTCLADFNLTTLKNFKLSIPDFKFIFELLNRLGETFFPHDTRFSITQSDNDLIIYNQADEKIIAFKIPLVRLNEHNTGEIDQTPINFSFYDLQKLYERVKVKENSPFFRDSSVGMGVTKTYNNENMSEKIQFKIEASGYKITYSQGLHLFNFEMDMSHYGKVVIESLSPEFDLSLSITGENILTFCNAVKHLQSDDHIIIQYVSQKQNPLLVTTTNNFSFVHTKIIEDNTTEDLKFAYVFGMLSKIWLLLDKTDLIQRCQKIDLKFSPKGHLKMIIHLAELEIICLMAFSDIFDK